MRSARVDNLAGHHTQDQRNPSDETHGEVAEGSVIAIDDPPVQPVEPHLKAG